MPKRGKLKMPRKKKIEEKTDDERIVEALLQIGLRVSPETRNHISLVYHSCGIEGCELTLEETAQTIGWPIREKLLEQKKVEKNK